MLKAQVINVNAEIWYTSIYHHPLNSIPILFIWHQSTFPV